MDGMNGDRIDRYLWWVVPGVLAGMPMPYLHHERRLAEGGPLDAWEDELPALYHAGIRAVVSLLNIPSDQAVYGLAGFDYLCLPVGDGQAPSTEQALEFSKFVDAEHALQKPVMVHCHAGIGRTGTMIAAYLIFKGDNAVTAIAKVRGIEPKAIETIRQIAFLEEFAAGLGRSL